MAVVGALPLVFLVKLGLVREKYIPAGLHLMSPPLLVRLGLLFFGQFGPVRCLLPALLRFFGWVSHDASPLLLRLVLPAMGRRKVGFGFLSLPWE